MTNLRAALERLRGYPSVRLPRPGMDWHPDPTGHFLQWPDVAAALAATEAPTAVAVPLDDASVEALTISILSNGIPHAQHSQACHDADAKLVRAAVAADRLIARALRDAKP